MNSYATREHLLKIKNLFGTFGSICLSFVFSLRSFRSLSRLPNDALTSFATLHAPEQWLITGYTVHLSCNNASSVSDRSRYNVDPVFIRVVVRGDGCPGTKPLKYYPVYIFESICVAI